MRFIRLHFSDSRECWVNSRQIEAVLTRFTDRGEVDGSCVRTRSMTSYDVAQSPAEVFELMNRVPDMAEE